MVYKEPQIKIFVDVASRIFTRHIGHESGIIYLIKYNSRSRKNIPKDVYSFYEKCNNLHIDGNIINLPNKNNNKRCIVLYGKDTYNTISVDFGAYVSSKLDNGNWRLFPCVTKSILYKFILGWGLAQYNFKNKNILKCIELPSSISKRNLIAELSGIYYGKELINIPSIDMGPDALEKSFNNFASYHKVTSKTIIGDDLIKAFPLIHAVGKASIEEPRLLELNWGNTDHPSVILVGKGVCFDTGGLDLKLSQYMRNMKKDMGGAASVLSLAHMIINSNLKINLKVLIPAVNNDIGPKSMRPGDVYNSREGIKVEIGNTDAEGRLILADALTYASEFKPKLIIDFATLTGAARVALGADIPAYFTHSDELSILLNEICATNNDPLWRLPLFRPYEVKLKSEFADTNNISNDSFAGSIIAALFLNKFVRDNTNWLHIDTYAWSDGSRAGYSKGGDILGVRSIYKLIKAYISNL
jgi:leucyl aminopeptidase